MKLASQDRWAQALPWLVILGAPAIYWLQSRAFTGPAYLDDEIGYLANAAFLAGHLIDGASRFHAGYSLFLTPLFVWLSDPGQIWQGVMVINTVFWVVSLFLLKRLLCFWFPDASSERRLLVLLCASLYPAWATMTGYAFSSSAVALVLMGSLFALTKWRPGEVLSLIPHSFLVGFLYWVHPTGLAVAAASLVAVAVVALRLRTFRALAVHALVLLAMIAFYEMDMQPWLTTSMTPGGLIADAQYPSIYLLASRMGDPGVWIRLTVMTLGQMAYLIVGTLGSFVFGVVACTRHSATLFLKNVEPEDSTYSATVFYVLLAVLLVAGMGSATFAVRGVTRVDNWVYGRYVDAVALPLIAFGCMALLVNNGWRSRVGYALAGALFVAIMGVAISAAGNFNADNAIIDTPAFWPEYLFGSTNFLLWMALGGAGVLAAAIGGKYVTLPLILASFIVGVSVQGKAHQDLLALYARPSSLVEIVRDNFPAGSCIAYDLAAPLSSTDYRGLRFQLYKFYFFNYRYRRMSVDQWRSDCDGPLLTVNGAGFIDDERTRVVARETFSGLFLVTKSSGPNIVVPDPVLQATDIYLAGPGRTTCLLAGCFNPAAADLKLFSQVGRLQDGYFATDMRAGYLFYGPYFKLNQGAYVVILRGKFEAMNDAVLDIVSNQGKREYFESKLCPDGISANDELVIPFTLDADVLDIEIRLRVSTVDRLAVSGYEIVMAQDDTPRPPTVALCEQGGALLSLPRQVGGLDAGRLVSNGRPGFLTFGPYAALGAGKYRLILHGSAPRAPSAWVDIVSRGGSVVYAKFPLVTTPDASPGVIAEGPVTITAPVDDLEVRVHVDAKDVVRLAGYELLVIDH